MKLDRFSKLNYQVAFSSTVTFALSRLISLKQGYERYDNKHSLFLSVLVGGNVVFWHLCSNLSNSQMKQHKVKILANSTSIIYTALLTLYSYSQSSGISPYIFTPLLGLDIYIAYKHPKSITHKHSLSAPLKSEPLDLKPAISHKNPSKSQKGKSKSKRVAFSFITSTLNTKRNEKTFEEILFNHMKIEANFIKDKSPQYKKFDPKQPREAFIKSIFRLGIYSMIKYSVSIEQYKNSIDSIQNRSIFLAAEWQDVLTLKLSDEEDEVLKSHVQTQKLEEKNLGLQKDNFSVVQDLFKEIDALTSQIMQDVYNNKKAIETPWEEIFAPIYPSSQK